MAEAAIASWAKSFWLEGVQRDEERDQPNQSEEDFWIVTKKSSMRRKLSTRTLKSGRAVVASAKATAAAKRSVYYGSGNEHTTYWGMPNMVSHISGGNGPEALMTANGDANNETSSSAR